MKSKLLAGLCAGLIAAAMVAGPVEARSKKPRYTQLTSKRVKSKAAFAAAIPAGRGHVVAMIKARAAGYGVPAWFALRIAKIESNYNPRARGRAGEYGVFQLKCQTARGLGFRGACSNLLNASTNVNWGLKHLGAAVRSSRGNLKLAASKHNGGLGRKSLVRGYVNRVF
jgi:soluble lytic murein transglycosylase-like protein